MKMNRKVIKRWLLPLMLAVAVSGCIKNDIPYPRLLGRITAFEVRGQIGEAVIDSIARTVTVDIEDTAVLTRLRLLRFELSDHTSVSPEIDSVIDLSSPKAFSLTTWPDQSYEWTVSATQTVERYIRVQNQVGEAVFNVDEHYAIFYVTFEQPLETVNITDMKLGPSNSTIEPDPSTVHDFSGPQRFTVRYRDVEELWTVVAYQKEAVLETGQADAWATAAYLYGTIPAGDGNAGFRYRTAGADQWQDVPSSGVTVDGTSVSALLRGLQPGTDYEYMITSASGEGPTVGFTTEDALQMPNMGFDAWNTTGGIVYPNADQNENAWWDSGNTGAKIAGLVPTSQETSFLATSDAGNTSAARLETVNAIIAMAGGNVFSGRFGKVHGLGAEVFFGRPFETRPLRLTGWYCYEPVPIDNVKPPENVALPFDRNTIKGRMDRCCIFVYVTAWDTPYRVNTTEHRYLDINDPDVIGYGELVDSTGTGGIYRQFSIDIKYRDHRKPTYCAVVAVASQYADFFTGGIGSLMYVDEFAFEYDGDTVWEENAEE